MNSRFPNCYKPREGEFCNFKALLINTVNQQRLEVLFFGDRTITLPYPNSATPLKEAVVAQRFLSEKSQISSPPEAPPSNPNPRYG
jgi:hypothetical protein